MNKDKTYTVESMTKLLEEAELGLLDIITVQLAVLTNHLGISKEIEIQWLLLYAEEKVKGRAQGKVKLTDTDKMDEFLRNAKGGEA